MVQRTRKGEGLSPKQKRFCEEYIVDLNATQAYVRAGYSTKSLGAAATEASKLLINPKIESYLNCLRKQRDRRTLISADRVLQEYADIGFSKITDVVSWSDQEIEIKDSSELADNVKVAIKQVNMTKTITKITEEAAKVQLKTTVQMHDKLKALAELARHTGISHDINFAKAVFAKYGIDCGFDENGNFYHQNIEKDVKGIAEG